MNQCELQVRGTWDQIWSVLDGIDAAADFTGAELIIPAKIGPEYQIETAMRLKGFRLVKDLTSLSFIAYQEST